MTAPAAELSRPDRDFRKAHELVRVRWFALEHELGRWWFGLTMLVNEVYRSEARQQWLYGAGRDRATLTRRGIDPDWARPTEPIVTNAWSARLSAHGWTEDGKPAAAAIDVVPVGADQRPWTKDDQWDALVWLIGDIGRRIGLVHFHAAGKGVTDRPHLQLREWSDREHRLVFPPSGVP